MSKIDISIKTLTPVHISSGKRYQPNFDFLHFKDEGQIALIDEAKVFDIVGEEQLSQWISAIDKEEDVLQFIRSRKKSLQVEDIAKRSIEVVSLAPNGSGLREQLHLGVPLKACIPGSSIKGSLRTAVLNQLIKSDPACVQNVERLKSGRKKQFKDEQIIAYYFGRKDRDFHGEYRLDANKDFMRLVRITDAYFDNATECHQLEIINNYRDGWGKKNQEAIYMECIPKDIQSNISIQIPGVLLQTIINGKFQKAESIKKNQHLININTLFQLASQLTAYLIEEELHFWKEEGNPHVIGNYMEVLQEISNQINTLNENECILRLGAASGWIFMTGGWPKQHKLVDDDTWFDLKRKIQKRNYPDFIPAPKTRKLLAGGVPMGFVKLSFI